MGGIYFYLLWTIAAVFSEFRSKLFKIFRIISSGRWSKVAFPHF